MMTVEEEIKNLTKKILELKIGASLFEDVDGLPTMTKTITMLETRLSALKSGDVEAIELKRLLPSATDPEYMVELERLTKRRDDLHEQLNTAQKQLAYHVLAANNY